MAQEIRLSFNVTRSYQVVFTPESWARYVEGLNAGLNPADLDVVYEWFDEQRWEQDEALYALGDDTAWVDNDRAEITDLEQVEVADRVKKAK